MGDHSPPCLNSYSDHQFEKAENVSNVLLHYFGCLRRENRKDFYDCCLPHQQLLIREEHRRIPDRIRDSNARSGVHVDGLARLLTFNLSLLRQSRAFKKLQRQGPAEDIIEPGPEDLASPPNQYGLNAKVMFFKDSEKYTDTDYPGEFPNQKIPLHELLYNKDRRTNLLMNKCPKNMIRYFHLPGNNMTWIEEAIARYYNEEVPTYEGIFQRPEHRAKTNVMLRPEFWRDQLNRSKKNAVYAGDMRPHRDATTMNPDPGEDSSPNFVLFMPYLHWETDLARSKREEVIRNVEVDYNRKKPRTFVEVVEQTIIKAEGRKVGLEGRMKLPSTILGRVLLLAAKLSEAISDSVDIQIVRENLYKDPPLQPRRTLDQEQFWTPKTTQQDQVVYRKTAPQKLFIHHHNCGRKKEECGPNHCAWTVFEGCDQCQLDIRKVARVITVDQLWLWILDGNTIITCFPDLWGKHKLSPSGIYSSLRRRLQYSHKGEIQSAYDLALIIIDQCSQVFFERTKPTDLQPRVMSLFKETINEIGGMQRTSYEHANRLTRLASEMYKSKDSAETSHMAEAFLDTYPEHQLLRETKDMIGELKSMIHIKTQQRLRLAEFIKHATHTLSDLRMSHREEKVVDASAHWWRKSFAQEVETGLEDHLGDLQRLLQGAENLELALRDLLDFKQQQAGAVLAYEAVRQGKETVKQGRSIMMFTVVTIIFLPLSFFTGIYGMNNVEFNNSNYGLYEQFRLMFPISFGIIMISLMLAFNSFIRRGLSIILSCVSFAVEIAWTYIVVSTGIYALWLDIEASSGNIVAARKRLVADLKAEAVGKKRAKEVVKALRKAKRNREIMKAMVAEKNKEARSVPKMKARHLRRAHRAASEEFMMV